MDIKPKIYSQKVPEDLGWKDLLAKQETVVREEVHRIGDQFARTFGW
jgi:hypothetical protein